MPFRNADATSGQGAASGTAGFGVLQISHSTGPLLDVKRRIELRMRAMEFEKNTAFIPTAEQAELSDTEFNGLVANETVVAVEYTIQRMVGILGDLVSQAAIPT